MASYETFYTGSDFPFQKPYGRFTGSNAYHVSVKDMAYPTDPLTANQLKKVSDKISTGAQTIEVSGLGLTGGGAMKHLASIPRQHWKEIDRLRKLTGVDLTFHGPLVESTGFSRGNWSEDQRVEAEKQMKAAVELAQQMNSEDKEKGIVMTFHSNNGLPEVEREVVVGRDKDGNPIKEYKSYFVINERTGKMGQVPLIADSFKDGEKVKFNKEKISEILKDYNEREWADNMAQIAFENNRARREISEAFFTPRSESAPKIEEMKKIQEMGLEMYGEYSKNPSNFLKNLEEDVENISKDFKNINKNEIKSVVYNTIDNLGDAETFLKQSYFKFKESFNEVYEKTKDKDTKNKLQKIRDKFLPVVNEFEKDKTKLIEFQKGLSESLQELRGIGSPGYYTPLREFAVNKGSETFSNVALHAYKNAKEHNRAPGIISIENPPAGMSGLTRAEEIKDLVEASRKKFVQKAVLSEKEGGLGLSNEEAKKTAEKIIGATWDVGHINSIQKWGYNRDDVLKQAKTIAPYVKHMHIADNLGFEDAELPIGMGNVPIDKMLDKNQAWTENFRKAKKTIETGDWFSRQGGLGMTKTPVTESLSGLSASVYSGSSMGDAGVSYWNDAVHPSGGYFGGLGPINPEVHHSIYGGGFSGVSAYLGAELPGKATNSSFSGAPLD